MAPPPVPLVQPSLQPPLPLPQVRLTSGLQQYLPSFVPSLLGLGAPPAVERLAVDRERHVLYALNAASGITVRGSGQRRAGLCPSQAGRAGQGRAQEDWMDGCNARECAERRRRMKEGRGRRSTCGEPHAPSLPVHALPRPAPPYVTRVPHPTIPWPRAQVATPPFRHHLKTPLRCTHTTAGV